MLNASERNKCNSFEANFSSKIEMGQQQIEKSVYCQRYHDAKGTSTKPIRFHHLRGPIKIYNAHDGICLLFIRCEFSPQKDLEITYFHLATQSPVWFE